MVIHTQAEVEEAFRQAWGAAPSLIAQAPGRVNLLGAHIDYNEGWVLPGAIDRRAFFAARPLAEPRLEVHSLDYGEIIQFPLDPPPRSDLVKEKWWRVMAAVAWVLRQEKFPITGLQLTLGSTIPIGAGTSSSAAVEIGLLLLWAALDVIPKDPWTLIEIARRAENEYMGVGSGVMDQFASLSGRENHLLFLDCRDHHHEAIPLPDNLVVLVADSGIRRRLSESGFNDRRAECLEATKILQENLNHEVHTLRDIDLQQLESQSAALNPRLYRRVLHVVQEGQRVRQGRRALLQGNLSTFGELIRASGTSSRELYEVSLPELDCLTDAANRTPGCLGSRLSGGGFGGCIVALCTHEASTAVQVAMEEAYMRDFGRSLTSFEVSISGGASGESRA